MIARREMIGASMAGLASLAMPSLVRAQGARKPNFLVIFCDDLGYGDVSQGPAGLIPTPNIDRMASEGVTLTSFYAAANLCTPSRAGMFTGRYPIRTGLAQGVILQDDTKGLPQDEVTLAEALGSDYASALIGKWHLGHVAPHWPPTRQGFDLFFGLPYSHDIFPLSLYEDNGPGVELTEEDVDFPQLQQRFCDRAERFIRDNSDRPFYVTLALSSPHLPNYPGPHHMGRSDAGLYGDTVVEIDDIVGRLVGLLEELDLSDDTLLILTSDNGPWFEGSTGGLRQRKGGGAYEGGYRVPFVARQPGTLPAGLTSNALGSGMDFMPTFCAMAGVPLPEGVEIDGKDISGTLRGGATPHDVIYLFDNEEVIGVRTQRWKYVLADYYRTILFETDSRGYPQLYDMESDPSESYSVAGHYPEVLEDMRALLAQGQAEFAHLRTTEGSGIFRSQREVVLPDPFRED